MSQLKKEMQAQDFYNINYEETLFRARKESFTPLYLPLKAQSGFIDEFLSSRVFRS